MDRLVLEGDSHAEVAASARIRIRSGANARIAFVPERNTPLKAALEICEGCSVSCSLIGGKGADFELSSSVGARSRLSCASLWLGEGRGSFSSSLDGGGAEASDVHVFIAGGCGRLSVGSSLSHNAPKTRGDILVKGIAAGKSRAELEGMIRIGGRGAGAESFLAEHVLLLGEDAAASAEPKLEIGNDDVSAKHAASVSRIDAEKVFYLMSRGIARQDAEGLIAGGFIASAIAKVGDAGAREAIAALASGALGESIGPENQSL